MAARSLEAGAVLHEHVLVQLRVLPETDAGSGSLEAHTGR